MKKSEVKNKHKNKDGNLKNILSIWHFKLNIVPNVVFIKRRPYYVHMEECNDGD